VHGTAHILPDDDPYARQRQLSRWHPLRAMNLAVVRIMGTSLLTIRIDLHTGEPQGTPAEDSGQRADQLTAAASRR
jgi:hypothetical protein